MKGVILSAGFGSRLGNITDKVPKPLVKVGEKAVIEYIIDYLRKSGIEEIAVNLHYLPLHIIKKLHGYPIKFFGEIKPLGTAGALKQMEKWLDNTFVVANGDTITNVSLAQMVLIHTQSQSMLTIYTKDTLGHNGGVFIFSKPILNLIPKDKEFSIHEDLIPTLLKKDIKISAYMQNDSYYFDVGTKEGLRKARLYFK